MLKRFSVLMLLTVVLTLSLSAAALAYGPANLTAKLYPVERRVDLILNESSIVVRLGFCVDDGVLYPPGSILGDRMCVDGKWLPLPDVETCSYNGQEYTHGMVVVVTDPPEPFGPLIGEVSTHTCYNGSWSPPLPSGH